MATSPRSMAQALAEEYRNTSKAPAMLSQVAPSEYIQPGTGTAAMPSPQMGTRSSDPIMNAIAGALLGAAGEMMYRKTAGAGGSKTGTGNVKGGGGGGKTGTGGKTKIPDIAPGEMLPSGPLIEGEDMSEVFPYTEDFDVTIEGLEGLGNVPSVGPLSPGAVDLDTTNADILASILGPSNVSTGASGFDIRDGIGADSNLLDIGDFEGIDFGGADTGVSNLLDTENFQGIDFGGIGSTDASTVETPYFNITNPNTGETRTDTWGGTPSGVNLGDYITVSPDIDFSDWSTVGQGYYEAPNGDLYFDTSMFDADNFDFGNYDFGGSYGEGYDFSDIGSYGFKDGGMATPMMSKGGYPIFADGSGVDVGMSYGDDAAPISDTAITSNPSIYLPKTPDWLSSIFSGGGDLVSDLFSTKGATGAILGALLSSLVGKSGGTSAVNEGFDWSKLGVPARKTDFGMGAPRYVPYADYETRPDVSDIYEKTNLYANLGAPAYEADTSASPLALSSPSPIKTSALDIYKPFTTGEQTPLKFPTSPLGYNATMANGGGVDTSYYTYGKAVDPLEKLQMMRDGGRTDDTAGVPVVGERYDYRKGARVTGEGDGQSDDIPAWLADGEYVIDAETVAQLGNGSTKAGSDLLDRFREEIRDHKRSAKNDNIPPPSKSPMQYLAMAGRK